jgi:hypothetical protein
VKTKLTSKFWEDMGVPVEDWDALFEKYPQRKDTGIGQMPFNCGMGLLTSLNRKWGSSGVCEKGKQQIVAGLALFTTLMYHGSSECCVGVNATLEEWGFEKVWECSGAHGGQVFVYCLQGPICQYPPTYADACAPAVKGANEVAEKRLLNIGEKKEVVPA